MGAMEPPTSLRVDSILRLSLTVTRFVPTVGRVAGASGKHENPPPEDDPKEVGEEGEVAAAAAAAAPTALLLPPPAREVREDFEMAPLL